MNGKSKNLKEYNEKITLKSPLVKGYYPFRHACGADRREFLKAFYFDSITNMEKSKDKRRDFVKEA